MIIVRPNYQPGKEVTYDLIQEKVLAQSMTLADAEWLAGLVNKTTEPKSPTVDYVRATFDQALTEAREKYYTEKLTVEQKMEQDAINAKLDSISAEHHPTDGCPGCHASAPFEGVPGCGCSMCDSYWKQKDRDRREGRQ